MPISSKKNHSTRHHQLSGAASFSFDKYQKRNPDTRDDGLPQVNKQDAAEAFKESTPEPTHAKSETAEAENKHLVEEVAALKATCQWLGEQLTTVTEENAIEWEESQARTQALKSALDKAERENGKLQNDVRVAQEGALRSIEKERHAFMDDSDVRERLEMMGDQFIAWSKRHALEDVSLLDSLPAKKMDEIIASLEGFCAQYRWRMLKSALPSLAPKLPLLLVQAALTKHLVCPMFSNPFFLFPVATQDELCPTPQRMQGLYKILLEGE
jgi:hypothetical protein